MKLFYWLVLIPTHAIAMPGSMSGNGYGGEGISYGGIGGPLIALILSVVAMRVVLVLTDKHSVWSEDWGFAAILSVISWVLYLVNPWLLVAAICGIIYMRVTSKKQKE